MLTKVGDVAQVVPGEFIGQAPRVPERERRDGGDLGQEPHPLDIAVLGIVNVLGVRVEGTESAHHAEQHAHGMGIVAEPFQELDDVGVDVGVVGDLVHPLVQFLLAGQLAFTEQPGHFQEAGLVRQLLDRVAAIAEDSLVAVDEGDRAAAGGGIHERRVIGHEPEVLLRRLDLAKVHRLDGAFRDGYLVGFAGAIVGDRE
jgi:hypothetical protein